MDWKWPHTPSPKTKVKFITKGKDWVYVYHGISKGYLEAAINRETWKEIHELNDKIEELKARIVQL